MKIENAIKQAWIKDMGFTSPCLLFLGPLNKSGYGMISLGARNNRDLIHRVVYMKHHKIDKLPDGMEINHLCRTRCCINIEHLTTSTHLENVRYSKHCKLTYEKAEEIRLKHSHGRSLNSLAMEYRVSNAAISQVIRGKAWKIQR